MISTLIVTNDEGCTDTSFNETESLITDFVYFLPNAFTPNGNNLNELYKPVATPYIHYYQMEIFNRWGEKLFETSDISQGWDGTYHRRTMCSRNLSCKSILSAFERDLLQVHELSLTLLR
ncbi:MAG: gliding motility-associated C-terminal domain-containing protein [Bacteroidia bacterium]